MRQEQRAAAGASHLIKLWRHNAATGETDDEIDQRFEEGGRAEGGQIYRHSHSGHERNHLFVNNSGTSFSDISTISGMDTDADSRSFVVWDYDHDGWQDVAMVNANVPLLSFFRNQMGARGTTGGSHQPRMIALRFVGGNNAAESSPNKFAPRDGYGAVAHVSLGETVLKREHRCGEGFAAQNSRTLIVGIGQREMAQSVAVRWPSGALAEAAQVPAGTLLTVYENPADSPTGEAFHRQPYLRNDGTNTPSVATAARGARLTLTLPSSEGSSNMHGSPRLRMFTTMATWCSACKRELPQLARLRAGFPIEDLALFGVPVDPEDNREKLNAYRERFQPAYELLLDISHAEQGRLKTVLQADERPEVLPATVITCEDGHVLKVLSGVPTVSQISQILARQQPLFPVD